MGDLIDWKSPDGKSTTGPKLASPLIPAPAITSNDEKTKNDSPSNSSGLNFVKRPSLDNNPFDVALHKTVDYARKHNDPFELVLEKALKSKDCESALTPKARRSGVEFKDDFTPKRTRYSDILKMNKTLDDSLIEAELNTSRMKKISLSPCGEDSIIHDLDNTSLLGGSGCDIESETIVKSKLQNGIVIPQLIVGSPSTNDLSILNQSAMNDSLTESSSNSEESLIKSIVAHRISMCIQKGTSDANNLAVPGAVSKQKQRSLSQSVVKSSPKKFRQQRSKSIADSLKAGMGNEGNYSICSMPSFVFEDNMNRAFLESQCRNNNSNITDLSNISAITRLNSVSSLYNSSYASSAFSNSTANRAFIESSVNDVSAVKNFDDKKQDRKLFSTSGLSRESSVNGDISDLLSKYSRLKIKSADLSEIEITNLRLPSVISGSGIMGGSVQANKLIDVSFVDSSEQSPPIQQSLRQSVSSTSSDSVFFETSKVDKSIITEAKRLARTFEELATKTSSSAGSSCSEDLVNSRPHWNFDILPVSDDEALVDLIDLPKSPSKNENQKNTEEIVVEKSSPNFEEKSDKSIIKELESEFIAPEKKVIASSLLIELENLVKSEGNPEAVKLLANLEKALGLRTSSNSELLASCFTTRNDLTKSPKRSDNPLGNENIKDDSNEKSCEDNIDAESLESLQQSSLSDDKNLQDNLNTEKEINKIDKSLVLVNEKYDKVSSDKELSENDIVEDSCDEIHDDSITAIKKQNQITDDQKMAVEILVGLGKLLTGENKDPMTANVLKNLGKVLNLAASNNYELENVVQTSVKESKRVDTPVKSRIATPPRKTTPISAFSRSANRRSLESSMKNKTPNERVIRRSISGMQTPSSTTPRLPIKPLSADKTKAHLKEIKTRFSSDPGLASSTAEKKRADCSSNNRKIDKNISLKPSDLAKQEQPSSTVVDAVKSKFRKKINSDVTNKKGPMKALIPLGNMQRSAKRVSPMMGSVTPPKSVREVSSSNKVTTSTPFPVVHLTCPKKSPKSKPMASSTPDGGAPKNSRRSAPLAPHSPKDSLSCNISPVTSKTDEADNLNSSKDNSKSKMSKIGTPSKSRSASQLPKLSPMRGIKSSPHHKSPRDQRRSEPLQSFLPRSANPPKSPSICVTEASISPLNSSNKLGSKVKPLNLISKLRRRSASVADKENYA